MLSIGLSSSLVAANIVIDNPTNTINGICTHGDYSFPDAVNITNTNCSVDTTITQIYSELCEALTVNLDTIVSFGAPGTNEWFFGPNQTPIGAITNNPPVIDLSTLTPSLSGIDLSVNHTTTEGSCESSLSFTLDLLEQDNTTFSYDAPICEGTNVLPNLDPNITTGGTFTLTSADAIPLGMSIDLVTGEIINPQFGLYTIEYETVGDCANLGTDFIQVQTNNIFSTEVTLCETEVVNLSDFLPVELPTGGDWFSSPGNVMLANDEITITTNETYYYLAIIEGLCPIVDTLNITVIDSSSCENVCSLNIPLDLGWNIISSYCDPVSDDMIAIFSGINNDVIQVKDLEDVYSPALGFNTFSGWEISNGYQVKTSVATTLNINGSNEVDPLIDVIPMNSGWNIIAYWLKNGVADPVDVFANIVTDVIQVKNLNGAYTPAVGFNGMGDMEITQGYQVKMANSNTLMYDPIDAMLRPESNEEIARLQPVHFTRNLAPHPNNATFILMDSEGIFNTEDEIAVFTHDGILVGSSVYQDNGIAGMLIYGIDETLDGVNGIKSGESFIVKSWDAVLEEERILEIEFLQGNPNYEKDDLIVAALKSSETGIEGISSNIKISLNPNPARTEINFDLELEEAEKVVLEIINIEGKQIDLLSIRQLPRGKTVIKYPTTHLNDGMFLLKMTQVDKVITKRFIVVN